VKSLSFVFALSLVLLVGTQTGWTDAPEAASQPTDEKETATKFLPRPDTSEMRYFKGNTHTHTTRSDGDSEPDVVARWYKERGYDFLVLTDHNVLTHPEPEGVADETFLLIPGEEVSARFSHNPPMEKAKPLHINALGLEEVIPAINQGESIADTLQQNIDAIRDADAVPHINHPNFRWAISHLDLLKVDRYNLLEIYNGHPLVNNDGDHEHIGMEAIWDILLTEGEVIYGVGVDDAHHFKGEFAPDRSNPGRAWVQVMATELTEDAILDSLEKGLFYFTTGPELERVEITETTYTVDVKTSKERKKILIQFIGKGGEILAETDQATASYELKGDELYVRAKITMNDSSYAWTQPAFTTNHH
jgi:hypothetical protein